MIIRDVMTKNPVYAALNTSVTEIKALMNKYKIGKIPILNKENKLVGILTRNDLLKIGPSTSTSLDIYEIGYLLSNLKAEKVMTKKVITVSPEEVVEEAAKIMVDKGIGCLPVMENDLLVGIVTESDLFHIFINVFGARTHGIRMTLILDEKPGQLSKLATKIAELGGNIVAAVTCDADDSMHRKLTIKASVLTIDQANAIVKQIGVQVEDIRAV